MQNLEPVGGSVANVLTDQPMNRSITISRVINGGIPVDTITQTGFGGATATWTVQWKKVTVGLPTKPIEYACVDRHDPWEDPCQLEVNHFAVDYIQLPMGGLRYQFGYSENLVDPDVDPRYGELNLITLPSGATASYEYGLDGVRRYIGEVRNRVTSKQVQGPDIEPEQWTYGGVLENGGFTHTTANPDGGTIVLKAFDPANRTNPLRGKVFFEQQPDGSKLERYWARNAPHGVDVQDPGNAFARAEYRTPAGGQTAATVFQFDKNGNLIEKAEHGYGVSVPRDPATTAPNGVPGGTPVRTETRSYYAATPAADSAPLPDQVNAYWLPVTDTNWHPLLSAVQTVEMHQGGANGMAKARTQFGYNSAFTTGNPTVETRGIGTGSTTQRQFDAYGNVTQVIDPNENVTRLTYGSVGGFSDWCLTEKKTAYGTPIERTFQMDCDFASGLMKSETDVGNAVTREFEYDVLGRPTKMTEAGMRETNTVYDDANRAVLVKSDLNTKADGKLTTVRHYDSLGRPRLERTTDGAPLTLAEESVGIKVERRYRTVVGARYELVSNPYTQQVTGWTRTKRDTAGRVVEVETFDGAGQPAPWGANSNSTGNVITAYNANEVSVTDQALKVKRSYTDGLGRLTSVVEDPAVLNYTTSYVFDVLDNLTQVNQGGQTRTFVYNSLSRLTDATNPESGHTGYTYDANGNVLTKTDARLITTTFDPYDALNRPTRKSYNDTPQTPEVSYSYDTCANGKGRLCSVSSTVSSSSFAYDALGRITASSQTTDDVTYGFEYSYNLADGLTRMQYPSGSVVSYAQDDAGRPTTVKKGEQTSTVKYAEGISYTPHGAITAMTLGNGVAESWSYNGRLQPLTITATKDSNTLLSLTNGYGGTNNNGNVRSQTIGPLNVTQIFDYDGVNRLKTASEGTAWSRTFDYDVRANQWVSAWSGPSPGSFTPQSSSWFDAATNRLTGAPSADYDAAGNQTQIGGYTSGYDAENRVKTSTINSVTTTYSYDGDGRRVKKGAGSNTTVFVYDAFGQLAAEYGAEEPGGTQYVSVDHLGSTRLVTDASGQPAERHDYLPFGEELYAGISGRTAESKYPAADTGVRLKFTGKERDAETGLDYFGARYFSGAQGRFTSPDEPLFDQDTYDPQSWNLYVYGRNNPLRYTDPTGRSACKDGKDKDGQPCFDVTVYSPKEVVKGIAKDTYNLSAGLLNLYFHYENESFKAHTGEKTTPLQLPMVQPSNAGQQKGVMLATIVGVLGSSGGRIIKMLEQDAGAIHLQVKSAKGTYEIMANMRREGTTLILDRTHIAAEGGRGSIGAGMRTELREAARQFGKEQGATEVIVNPGVRLGGRGDVTPLRVVVQ